MTFLPTIPLPCPDLSWRELDAGDLDEIYALHRQAIGNAGVDIIKPESREFFARLLNGDGTILGVITPERQLVAYGVIQRAWGSEEQPEAWFGWRDRPIAKLAGASVMPAWRGVGLQLALIHQRVLHAGEHCHFYATVAPGNAPSWQNMLLAGFQIVSLRRRYGDALRYMLTREPAAGAFPTPTAVDASRPITDTDLDQQAALLRNGWRGLAARTTSGTRYLLVDTTTHAEAVPS
ncbi:MAG: hypothetical protein WC284_08670 [Candidimonas sp.]|jgi:GNAT superfamily N-acetyltransferase